MFIRLSIDIGTFNLVKILGDGPSPKHRHRNSFLAHRKRRYFLDDWWRGTEKYASFMFSLNRQSPFWKSSLKQNIPSVLKCWYGINWLRSFKFITFSPSFPPMIGPRNGPLLQQVTQSHCMFVTQVWRLWKFSLNWNFKGRDFVAFYKLQYFKIFCDNVLRSTKCFNLLAKESILISLNFSNFLRIFPLELHVDITWWRSFPFRLHCQLFNHWIHQSFVLICLPRCTNKILFVTDALQKSFSVALKSRFERPSFFYRFQGISL